MADTRGESQTFTIVNKNKAPRLIVLEPWAEEYLLAVGEKFEIVFGGEPISVDITMEQRGKEEAYTDFEGVVIDAVVLWVENGSIARVDRMATNDKSQGIADS